MLRKVEFIGSGYEVVGSVFVDTPTMAEAFEAAVKWYKDTNQIFNYCEMEIPKEYAFNESLGSETKLDELISKAECKCSKGNKDELFNPQIKDNLLENFFKLLQEQEKKYGVEIDLEPSKIKDVNHLDCLWYGGGEIGSIKYKDYSIVIGAYGDIKLGGLIDGKEFYFKDKQNSDAAYYEFGKYIDDKRLYELLDSQDENNYLTFENNNWFEVDLIGPSGEFIDLCGMDNVLDNNILDCFADVSAYFEYVDLEIKEVLNHQIKSLNEPIILSQIAKVGEGNLIKFNPDESFHLWCVHTPEGGERIIEEYESDMTFNDLEYSLEATKCMDVTDLFSLENIVNQINIVKSEEEFYKLYADFDGYLFISDDLLNNIALDYKKEDPEIAITDSSLSSKILKAREVKETHINDNSQFEKESSHEK